MPFHLEERAALFFFSEAAGKAIQSCGFEPAAPHRNKETEIKV